MAQKSAPKKKHTAAIKSKKIKKVAHKTAVIKKTPKHHEALTKKKASINKKHPH